MDTETIIPYAAAVLNSCVKTDLLKAHLKEGSINVIHNCYGTVAPSGPPVRGGQVTTLLYI